MGAGLNDGVSARRGELDVMDLVPLEIRSRSSGDAHGRMNGGRWVGVRAPVVEDLGLQPRVVKPLLAGMIEVVPLRAFDTAIADLVSDQREGRVGIVSRRGADDGASDHGIDDRAPRGGLQNETVGGDAVVVV